MINIPDISGESFWLVSPILIYSLLAFISLVWGSMAPNAAAKASTWLGMLGSVAIMGIVGQQWGELSASKLVFADMVSADRFSLFFTGLTALITLLVLPLLRDYFEDEGIHVGEAYTLLFFCSAGIIMLAMSNDLMMLFIAVELMSLSAYVLTGFNRGNFTCIEGALKYFILGSFASGILLFGIAFIYGATGTTNIAEIGQLLTRVDGLSSAMEALGRNPRLTPEVLPYGVVLLLIGMAFKIGSAPFHMWVPDVYQGAPAPVTAYMSTGVKAAALAAFLRILMEALPNISDMWEPIIIALSLLTMIIGNVAALVQRDVKRMLAYSSVAHGGYAMTGFLALGQGDAAGASGILLYMVAYAVMNIGAFAVLVHLQQKATLEVTDLDSYGGLGFKFPVLGAAMTLFMLSLGGLPPTAGFVAKFNLFSAVVNAGHTGLIILALVTSMASMYYYLRVVVYLYMRPEHGEVNLRSSMMPTIIIGASALAVLAIGLFPSSGPFQFIQWARASVLALL